MNAQLEFPMPVQTIRQSPESETVYRAIVRLRRSGYSVHRAGCDHVVKRRGGKRVQLLSKIHLLLLSGAISRAEP
jgi:hypothetical protein